MTPNELAIKTLQKLGKLASGSLPDSDDINLVTVAYTDYYDELLTEHLVDWGVADDIPEKASRALVALMALEVSDEFTIPEAKIQRLQILEDRNKARLAYVIAPDYIPEPIPAVYY